MRHSTGVYLETRWAVITKLAITFVAMLLLPVFGLGILGYFLIYGF